MATKNEKKLAARHSARSTDLKAELLNYIKLVQWARELLEKKLQTEDSGFGKESIFALRDIGISLDRAVACRIKYDKHSKSLADDMTHEEEKLAMIEYMAGLENAERWDLIDKIIKRHNLLTGADRPARNRAEPPSRLDDEAEYDRINS